MEYKDITLKREGALATLTLNHPERLNALTYTMIGEILQALTEVESDESVRCLIVTGAGRAFCAGDNLKGMGSLPEGWPVGTDAIAVYQQMIMKKIRGLPKPVIAALNGYTLGMGLDLAMACDIRIASEEAMLGDPRIQRALHAATGATWMMPRLIGTAKTIELMFTGDHISAREAERINLVTGTVPAVQFQQAVREWAERFASGPTKVYAILKKQIYEQASMDQGQAIAHMLQVRQIPVEDSTEGKRAFVEKRQARFTGR